MNETSVKGYAAVLGREETECSFAPYIRGLDYRTVLQNGEQRKDGALREIRLFEEAARIADDVAKLKVDWLQMSFDPLAAACLQGAEQLIARRFG